MNDIIKMLLYLLQEVYWWPPRYPNGAIKHYILTFEAVNENGYGSSN